MEIFCRNHSFPASKMLTLKRKEPFELSAFYKPEANIPHTESHIGTYCHFNYCNGIFLSEVKFIGRETMV